jgi:hypothetical protein
VRTVCGIEVRLVARPTPIDAVEIEAGRAEVDQVVEVAGKDSQMRCRVEGQVVIKELTEVGVGHDDAAVLLSVDLAFGRRGIVERGGHRVGELFQVVVRPGRRVELREETPEPAFHGVLGEVLRRDASPTVPPRAMAQLVVHFALLYL